MQFINYINIGLMYFVFTKTRAEFSDDALAN